MVKNLPSSAGDIRDVGSIPGLGRSPEKGLGSPLQYSWLENPMDGGVLREINPEYSLGGLMLKLKLQYFGHLM